ncbi:VOC family protein [Marivirga sp. S37H4]|uniref:VOC family protein n=1 Tax=Marivirga aurantiaca TaxID=2802615 RepID=A0A934WZQ9_9BACT|nr:VOC family protein [Marivirga aurantiaca]
MRRIVPNIYSDNLEASKAFYVNFLQMDLMMDLGWVLTFASGENPTAQISIFKNEGAEKPDNKSIFLSIEVSDVDKMYERAEKMDCDIVYKLTDEDWGVRRFFVKDPNGVTINLLTHKN